MPGGGLLTNKTTTSIKEFPYIPHGILIMSLLKKIFSSKTNASSISKPDLGGSPEAEVEQLGLFLLKDNTAAANNLE